jgi:hypothetical protein
LIHASRRCEYASAVRWWLARPHVETQALPVRPCPITAAPSPRPERGEPWCAPSGAAPSRRRSSLAS